MSPVFFFFFITLGLELSPAWKPSIHSQSLTSKPQSLISKPQSLNLTSNPQTPNPTPPYESINHLSKRA